MFSYSSLPLGHVSFNMLMWRLRECRLRLWCKLIWTLGLKAHGGRMRGTSVVCYGPVVFRCLSARAIGLVHQMLLLETTRFSFTVQIIGKNNFLAVSFLAVFFIIADFQLLKNSGIFTEDVLIEISKTGIHPNFRYADIPWYRNIVTWHNQFPRGLRDQRRKRLPSFLSLVAWTSRNGRTRSNNNVSFEWSQFEEKQQAID